jgi:FemAB-related protein (PEP-CTERM system-associated)
MDIVGLTEGLREPWDRFVHGNEAATFFHLSGWREIIERAGGHRTHYLAAVDQGEIKGVLPLAHVDSRLFGNALVSLPFCVYGGTVAVDEDIKHGLENAACDLGNRLAVDWVEFRNIGDSGNSRPKKHLHARFCRELPSDADGLMASIPGKQRAVVRKAIGAGLECRESRDVDAFYELYAESMRNLGTPVFPRQLFQALVTAFPDHCRILGVYQGSRCLASVMSFYFRGEVHPYYVGVKPESRKLRAQDFLYWELMRRSVEEGIGVFDFGRSKIDTGAYHYKRHWGFEPRPLNYEFELIGAQQVPDVNPLNPKYRLFIEAWKRLPLFASKLIGPHLARNLG